MRDFVFRDLWECAISCLETLGMRDFVFSLECAISCLETLGMRDFVFRDFMNARFRV